MPEVLAMAACGCKQNKNSRLRRVGNGVMADGNQADFSRRNWVKTDVLFLLNLESQNAARVRRRELIILGRVNITP